ncbi:hypothetical protein CAOG_06431 [Capsaspora owczarzaki ATCC 30864]|uniref:Hexosyltransferase n=1 Tax=Capsaspora owczarzaki (strain ATCC 30864) TaxID=595528 RepID=A0A0D2X4H3_CAPO3|nr:hypothetical protein CAOG_06431 [Capsaspora owczarzaki ATCC 30864]KJE96059.1 hypothetical protein CAOG_006431 [Capsaspora owczarzaki ATCC 30864]|eukprot:XP_004345180.1 hypothetical protein CAOG_06431 [Capsaspora owczarzaki ATCC 30864]
MLQLLRLTARRRRAALMGAAAVVVLLLVLHTVSKSTMTAGAGGLGGVMNGRYRDNGAFHGEDPTDDTEDLRVPADGLVNIMTAADETTLVGVPALIRSVLGNTNESSRIHFYIAVDSQISAIRLTRWLEGGFQEGEAPAYSIAVMQAEWVEGRFLLRGSTARDDLAAPTNFARYFVLDLFPEMKGRVVYLDADVIVTGNIIDLHNHRIEGRHLAAFFKDCRASFLNFENKRIQAMQLLPKHCGLNAGVYVADLERWNALNVTAQLMFWLELNTREHLFQGEEIGGGSQGPMQIVFNNRRTNLDPAWNIPHLGFARGRRFVRDLEMNVTTGNLFHWAGPAKPWLTTPGALLPNLWAANCVPEPELTDADCPADTAAAIDDKDPDQSASNEREFTKKQCSGMRNARAANLAAKIAVDCDFPVPAAPARRPPARNTRAPAARPGATRNTRAPRPAGATQAARPARNAHAQIREAPRARRPSPNHP